MRERTRSTTGPASDALYGRPDNDTIHGGLGGDLIYGGMGDDQISATPASTGSTRIPRTASRGDDGERGGRHGRRGGPGRGRLRQPRRRPAYAITLDNVANDGLDSIPGGAAEEGDNVHDDVEDVTGDAGGTNLVTGSSAPNVIQGVPERHHFLVGGNDTVGGSYGNDMIDGGTENDILNGFYGDDTLLGQNGNDQLFGQGDNDTLTGGLGNDNEVGELGDDTLVEDGTTANGADTLNAGTGIDTLSYKSRTVGVTVDLDTVTGDDGEDTNNDGVAEEGDTVTSDFEKLEGGAGPDKLTGQAAAVANTLTGNGGADILTGNDGDDLLDGGLGADHPERRRGPRQLDLRGPHDPGAGRYRRLGRRNRRRTTTTLPRRAM